MGVEAVIGMQPEDIGLVRFLKVGNIEGALVHVEVPLLLLELRIGALEINHPITFGQVVANHYHCKVAFLRETLDQVDQLWPRTVIDSFEFIKIVGIDLKQILFFGHSDIVVISSLIRSIVEVVVSIHRVQGRVPWNLSQDLTLGPNKCRCISF